MIISEDLLVAHGAVYEHFTANDIVFHEGAIPKYYFQIIKGTVELKNYSTDGKEFIHNIIAEGQCFGESLLFTDKEYPMTAVTKTECTIIKLSKAHFLKLICQNSDIALKMFDCLSELLYFKYLMSYNVASGNPLFKIKALLDYMRGHSKRKYGFEVPLTRQQLANFTGLRVETVIRAVKKMEKQNMLKIENAKIYY